jgi:hypothetical protein
MKNSQAYSFPTVSACPPGDPTSHLSPCRPPARESGLRLRSKAAGFLAALFVAGIGSAGATDFIRNGGFEGTGGTPDPGYVTGFTPYSPANLYFPWSAFGGTGTGGGFEQPNGVGRIANPSVGAANNSPTVWQNFGNPTYVNTASQNYMSDVWLIPGAAYRVKAQFYIPSSEVTAGTQPRAGIFIALTNGTIRLLDPRYPNNPANPASATIPVTDAWHTYDFNWVCPSVDAGGNPLTGPTRVSYTSYRWYGGDPTLTPDVSNNFGLSQGTHTNPGGYLDNVQISSAAYTGTLSGLVKIAGGPLQGAAVTVAYNGSRFRTDPVNPITPTNGTYSVAGLIPGQVYSITASKAGYLSKTVTATSGSTVPVIVLEPLPLTNRYEAENAVLSGCSIISDPNASNGNRVSANNFGGNNTITYTLNVAAAGLYPMTIGYYQPFEASRNTYLTVNGAALGTIPSPQIADPNYGVTAPRNIALNAGANTVVLSNGVASGPHWDYIELQQSAVPSATVSGTVTDGGSPVSGAVIKAFQTANPSLFNLSAPSAADGSYSLRVAVGNEVQLSASSLPAGKQVTTAPAPFTAPNSTAITGKNITLSTIPGYNPDLLFALKTESLSGLSPGDPTGDRPTAYPLGGNMVSLGSPTVVNVDGLNWEKNDYADADGYRFVASDVPGGAYNAPIPTNGVSVVAVVQPTYIGVAGESRGEIVDFFYSDLFLAVSHSPANEGEVQVCWRGYASEYTGYKIPDGQKTVLSLVVQPNGDMKLYANGLQKWEKATGVDYTSLQQTGLGGGAKTITVGRNDYDGWSTFSGNIADVYVYKIALDNTALTTLQDELATKFSITFPQTFNIVTSATNGTINPSGTAGTFVAEQGTDQTFNFVGTSGSVDVVTVDGVIQSGNPTSYTFTNIQANHTLGVTFTVLDPPNPYSDWASIFFVQGDPNGAMEMDPDNDGRNNLQEYAFDEDPTNGAASGHMRTSIEDDGGQKALMLTVAVMDSAVFTGSPSLSATARGVVYTIEGSSNLSGFNQVVTEVTPARSSGMPEPFGGWNYRTFRLSGPISAQPAGFIRVRTAPAP